MTIEGTGKYLRALDAQIHAAIFDGRNSRLRNAREFGQLALAQFFKLSQDTDRFSRRDLDAFFAGRNSFISRPPVIVFRSE